MQLILLYSSTHISINILASMFLIRSLCRCDLHCGDREVRWMVNTMASPLNPFHCFINHYANNITS